MSVRSMEPQSSVEASDGEWSWVVAVVSFTAQLLSCGSPQAVGVLYPEWLAAFRGGKAPTAWVGSLASGVGLLASPICSAWVLNFGARPVTVFSGVVVAGGFFLSAFTPSIQFLIFSYRIVVGLGCGLVYVATVTITCQYFHKRCGLALGIVTTGTEACKLFLGDGEAEAQQGCFEHFLVTVNAFRRPPPGTSVGGFLYAAIQVELIEGFGLDRRLLVVGALSLNIIACAGLMRPLRLPRYLHKQKAALRRTKEMLPAGLEKTPVAADLSPPTHFIEKSTVPTPSDGVDIPLDVEETCARETKLFNKFSPKRVIKVKQQACCKYMKNKAAFLHSRVYLSLCVFLFLFSLGSCPPVLFMEDVAQSKGLTEETGTIPLVSITATGNCLGKVLLGVMVDLKRINRARTSTFLCCLALGWLSLSFQASTRTLAFGSCRRLWGSAQGVGPSHLAPPPSWLTQADGILMFFGGFGVILGPPVVGWFYDRSQRYDFAFYFSGSCVLLGGFTLLLSSLPCWDEGENEDAEIRERRHHS
ncbi:Monocarboxylate transporter 9-like [Scleropages formosus]|uniref:Monocarboxylate transporter 9-like n=1 Tax=Scleropages formosus TaxID=113540 RepID=A0A0P7WJH0_SCLFO|nr:Monocarboxylate transporter 9-like [Scleropages formosus]